MVYWCTWAEGPSKPEITGLTHEWDWLLLLGGDQRIWENIQSWERSFFKKNYFVAVVYRQIKRKHWFLYSVYTVSCWSVYLTACDIPSWYFFHLEGWRMLREFKGMASFFHTSNYIWNLFQLHFPFIQNWKILRWHCTHKMSRCSKQGRDIKLEKEHHFRTGIDGEAGRMWR